MKKALTKIKNETFYFVDGGKIFGVHDDISGDVTDIWGNVNGISGNVTDIRGNVTGIRGDVDDCGISKEDRIQGISIDDLAVEE